MFRAYLNKNLITPKILGAVESLIRDPDRFIQDSHKYGRCEQYNSEEILIICVDTLEQYRAYRNALKKLAPEIPLREDVLHYY